MQRSANATWSGGLKGGQGTFSVSSGAFRDRRFSFRTRFEDEPGTNPEELIAAAHASCFSMAFSAQLGERGITPEAIETNCTITFENLTLTHSLLQTTVSALPEPIGWWPGMQALRLAHRVEELHALGAPDALKLREHAVHRSTDRIVLRLPDSDDAATRLLHTDAQVA